MLKNRKAKGRKGDNIIKNLFKKYLGFDVCIFSAASLSPIDMVICDKYFTFLIQNKFSKVWPPDEEEYILSEIADKLIDNAKIKVISCRIDSVQKRISYENRTYVRMYKCINKSKNFSILIYEEFKFMEFIDLVHKWHINQDSKSL